MCGISGQIKFKGKEASVDVLERMMNKMRHRGPDDKGIYKDGRIGLGFVRLSILDLSEAGHQPFISSDERYVMIFNGEIFNYVELRKELEGLGYTFGTKTDTEVLLSAYIHWGEECLNRLNGMWAFVIYDKQTEIVFGARDRYGIKPFYYAFNDEEFLFASEIPSILSAQNKKQEPNYQTIFDFLVFNRTDHSEKTFFKGIEKLQHGHCFVIQGDEFSIRKWYNLRERVKSAEPFSDEVDFRDSFKSSIELRLRSDVPVGVCLSGGLDSSSIVSVLLKDFEFNSLNTFSAVYGEGIHGDESGFINSYRGELSNMNFTTPSSDSLKAEIVDFVKTHAEPIPSTSPYAQYKVMELASKSVVVTLDGQGADEHLTGYHYFYGFYFKDLLLKGRFRKLINEIRSYSRLHKSSYGILTLLFFLLPKSLRTSLRMKEKGYLNKNFSRAYKDSERVAGNIYSSDSLSDALMDHFEFKLEHLLKWEDRNSMRFSIEARTPYLDFRLVERSLATSADLKIKDGITKHILRESMKGILPDSIRLRMDKLGFETPQDDWFRQEHWKTFVWDIINSSSFKSRGIINHEKAKDIFNRHINGEASVAKEIWKWIHLELWFREFIDQKVA